MEEQNSDAKGEIQDNNCCSMSVGKRDTASERGNGCRECDPMHNESMARCCDGRSTVSCFDGYILKHSRLESCLDVVALRECTEKCGQGSQSLSVEQGKSRRWV